MSKEFNAKLEVDKILTKSQKDLLNKIESYRLQIKEVRERELSKALIPVHEHRAGSTVGMGTEDVPPSKANPKGIDKNMGATPPAQGVNKPPPPMPSPVAKAEMCKKCGNMHMPLDKCGDIKINAKKSELIDEKGKVSSNSVNSPHPEPKKVVGDKGGIRLPGASLKKGIVFGNKAAKKSELEKALTAGGANAAPSTLVNGDALAGKGKKGPKKPVSLQVQPDPERKSELVKGTINPSKEHHGPSEPEPVKGEHCEGCGTTKKPLKQIKVQDSKPYMCSDCAGSYTKAEPPMAKPPSGKNMATHVPTSTAKKAEPMAKGLFSDAAQSSDPSAASFAAHSAANAKPQGKLPKMGGPNAAASARAADFADAMSGQTPPKTAVPQAQPFASPKAAGVIPLNPANKPPAIAPVSAKPAAGKAPVQTKPATAPAKVGIFGKIGGFRKP